MRLRQKSGNWEEHCSINLDPKVARLFFLLGPELCRGLPMHAAIATRVQLASLHTASHLCAPSRTGKMAVENCPGTIDKYWIITYNIL